MLLHAYILNGVVQRNRLLAAIFLVVSLAAIAAAQEAGQIEKEIGIKAFELRLGKPRSEIRRVGWLRRVANTAVSMQEFQGGRVYWNYATHAVGIHGDILGYWLAKGADQSQIGFPLMDETACDAQGKGNRFQLFEFAAFYWSSSTRDVTTHWIRTSADPFAGFGSLPACLPASSTNAKPVEESNRFRVILTGFTVNRQTSDNVLESDGKGDEVLIVAEVAKFDNSEFFYRSTGTRHEVPVPGYWMTDEGWNGRGNITLRRSLTSIVFGDANNQETPRMRAGSAGEMGGLRTGDKFPSSAPWSLSATPSANRLPMLLWEGQLENSDLVIIIPTIWEWDDGSFRSRREFTEAANKYFETSTRSDQGFALRQFGERDTFGAGDRPIGWREIPKGLRLDLARAYQAALDSPTGHGRGIHEFTYTDYDDTESYTLYIKVERLP